MAIDRIPGVGPANSDIAAAVAAPSAASIAAAVAAPSAATIAAAVAAPSAATIASAVAAPSAASIASAVAAPSLASITSAIQANAGSPFGVTWTSLGATSMASSSSTTISSLSGYKYLKFILIGTVASYTTPLQMRLNGDTGATNYAYAVYSHNAPNNWGGIKADVNDGANMAFISNPINTNGKIHATIEIYPNNATVYKTWKVNGMFTNSVSPGQVETLTVGEGLWKSTAAITSASFGWNFYGSATWGSGSTVYAFGGN